MRIDGTVQFGTGIIVFITGIIILAYRKKITPEVLRVIVGILIALGGAYLATDILIKIIQR